MSPPTPWFHCLELTRIGAAISKQECTVINIGDPDGPPRLVRHPNHLPSSAANPHQISYLSSGQGFTWNPGKLRARPASPPRPAPEHPRLTAPEIFLPSYIDHDYVPLENRRDPIHEIYLTDEEAATMLPQ